VSIRSDPFRRLALAIDGKQANGEWTYDEVTGLTITAEWGPGPRQRTTITIGGHNAVEVLFALLRPAAAQLSRQREADIENYYRQQDYQRPGLGSR
jgi:hypothetical protein